jgi:NADH:ubiquinone oxidoreductase subunit K
VYNIYSAHNVLILRKINFVKVQVWINFWIFFFWLSIFGFLFNPSNFISLLFFSEVTWLTLYCYTLVAGCLIDDLTLVSITFFILGFASLEFSFGFLLLILFKNFNVSFNLIEKDKVLFQYFYGSKNSLYLDKYFWNK